LLNEKNEIIDGKIAWKKLEISQQRMSSGQTIMEDSDERERVGLIQQTEDRIIFQKRRRIDW
jgi:hypothetical protein